MARKLLADPDSARTLFFWGFEIDELLADRLREQKSALATGPEQGEFSRELLEKELPAGQRYSDDYHVYSVEWKPNWIQWKVDGNVYHTLTPDRLPAGAPWAFNKPFFVLLNVAVGGAWPGYPDASTVFPQRMEVDYMRVYSPQ